MLALGEFHNKGNLYTVYYVETKKQKRLDIMRIGSKFNLEPENLLFSRIITKKKVLLYGDTSLLNDYTLLRNEVENFKATIEDTIKFDPDLKVMVRTQVKEKGEIKQITVMHGINKYQEFFKLGDDYLDMKVIGQDYSFDIQPLNVGEYQEALIEESTSFSSNAAYYPIEVIKTRMNLKHIDERDYLVVDQSNFEFYKNKILNEWEDVTAIDFETTGIDIWIHGEDTIVSLIISHKSGSSYYFPVAHLAFENITEEQYRSLYGVLREIEKRQMEKWEKDPDRIFEGMSRDSKTGEINLYGISAYNTKFECKCLLKEGEKLRIKHDGLAASMTHNPRQGRGIHALKTEVSEIEGKQYIEFEDIFKDMSQVNFAAVDKDIAKYYGCPDPDNLRTVLNSRINSTPTESLFIYNLESDLAEVKASQEYWGQRIEIEGFTESYTNVRNTYLMLERSIRELAKWPDLKITSNKELAELLYTRMRAPVKVVTADGSPSTGALALKALSKIKHDVGKETNLTHDIKAADGSVLIKKSDINVTKYPIVLFLLKYREYSKLLTAFYSRIEKSAKGVLNRDENGNLVVVDGKGSANVRYNFWINSFGTQTGRQSSPAHQFPKGIKKFLTADSEDHYMIGTDYMAVELRAFFSEAGEVEFIKMASDPSFDLHRIIGSRITGKEMWEISADERKRDKSRNFGTVYLISGYGLAVQKYGAAPTKAQVKECEESIAQLYKAFPRAARMVQDSINSVMQNGYMRDKLGRYRHFDIIFNKDATARQIASAKRQGNNMRIQGTCAEIMKIAEVNINNEIKRRGFDKLVETRSGKFPLMRIIISAHDEIQCSVHKSIVVEEALEIIRDGMEMTFEGWAPLFAESSVAYNWYDTHSGQYALNCNLRNKLIDNWHSTGVSAVKNYDNIRDELLEIIMRDREDAIVEYMESLIEQAGENPEAVAKLVRHPSLTHDIIAQFPQSKEHKYEHGELTHIESIRYAVERYFEYRETGAFRDLTHSVRERAEDTEIKETTLSMVDLTEELYDLDAKGNPIYSEEYEEVIEEFSDDAVDAEKLVVESTAKALRIYVWQIGDTVVFDADHFLRDQIDAVMAEAFKHHDKNGFFRLHLMYGGKLIDTKIRYESRNVTTDVIIPLVSKFNLDNEEALKKGVVSLNGAG